MSAASLKFFALLCMLIDHIGVFILGSPIWFRWIGRLSFPIFMFLFSWSIDFTRDYPLFKKKIYIFNVIMCVFDFAAAHLICYPNNMEPILNNIFGTFFAFLLLIEVINAIRFQSDGWRKKVFLYVLWQFFTLMGAVFPVFWGFPDTYTYFFAGMTGNLFLNEGRLFWILIGVIFYFTKKDRFIMGCMYTAAAAIHTCIISYSLAPRISAFLSFHLGEIGRILGEWGIGLIAGYPIYTSTNPDIFLTNYQWMMIFALPFILLYNGKRGNGGKYFYYWFYPLHIMVPTSISAFL